MAANPTTDGEDLPADVGPMSSGLGDVAAECLECD
ncbi:Protein of unknown function [Propionibacterium freudenreichii]|nr:Protein of unknown function [Propionibacterium freudenreichii]CEH09235.1 Protein of unknown function [Propionibacterium freudenreichii]CEI28408.1 Protein of unknown function [Propionibacterium freudenreichii]CEI31475.1 Protein of unknown function [Propionibacterium freudenreichii]CEI50027.1 Protein of unknown function [Propionibacterium freudenreichii]